MSRQTATLSADGATLLANIVPPRKDDDYCGELHVYGTFGGGTVKLQVSPDGGTTKNDYKDLSGVVWTATAADVVSFEICGGGTNSTPQKLYITLTGATAPSISVVLYDNR